MSEGSRHPEAPEPQRREDVEDAEVVEGQVVPPQPKASPRHRRLDVDWQESRYASPLPSPDDLKRYKELLPDAPERLLAAGEREQKHRHMLEERLVSIDESATPKFYDGQRRGHFISLVLGGFYETIMLVAVLKGYALEGIVGAAAGIGAMVWAIRRDPGGSDDSADDAKPSNELGEVTNGSE